MTGRGAWRSAQELSARLGTPVRRDAIEELHARGLVAVTGDFKGCALYSAEDLAAVTYEQALAAEAAAAEIRRMSRQEAARYLDIRQADFDLLVKAGLIIPDDGRWGQWGWVRLYLRATLDAFAARPGIDWAEVRSTPNGRRSPLHKLAEPELIMLALGGPEPPRMKDEARR